MKQCHIGETGHDMCLSMLQISSPRKDKNWPIVQTFVVCIVLKSQQHTLTSHNIKQTRISNVKLKRKCFGQWTFLNQNQNSIVTYS